MGHDHPVSSLIMAHTEVGTTQACRVEHWMCNEPATLTYNAHIVDVIPALFPSPLVGDCSRVTAQPIFGSLNCLVTESRKSREFAFRNTIVILRVASQVFGSQIMLWFSRVVMLSKRSLLLWSHITECAT
jgi:hypothetical protein